MANKKITELDELSFLSSSITDVLPIVDIDADITKKITLKTLRSGSFSGSFSGDGSTITTLVNNGLVLEGTTSASTSQAVYGVNVVTSANISNFATRLPDPVTGRQTVIINNSTMPISVFPSVAGGSINGSTTGSALIPNDGQSYLFYCIENPLPGAWSYSAPTFGQIELPEIAVSHSSGVGTYAYGIGTPGAQIISTNSNIITVGVTGSYGGSGIINLLPSSSYWLSSSFNPKRTLVKTKVYSNFKTSDSPDIFLTGAPSISRHITYFTNSSTTANYTATLTSVYDQEVNVGPSGSSVEIGDAGTYYNIQDANIAQASPSDTDSFGIGNFSPFYHTFKITIPSGLDTKVYKFKIFLEHS
jgi:hypothetical protein